MGSEKKKDGFSTDRERMLRLHLKDRGIVDDRVLGAMQEIRREEFVPESYRSQAYTDGPLPIGNDQTISQPYIVALMTQELRVNHKCNVLELGTGSGYQTAILANLARRVYTIERIADLSTCAQTVLNRLGVGNVEFFVGDGSCGWPVRTLPESGFFERIMITAAVPEVPQPVFEQLADGGRLVAPIGGATYQRLIAYQKRGQQLIERFICDVRFVRLIGEFGFDK